jgi:NitT/TauT family transport system permease protein
MFAAIVCMSVLGVLMFLAIVFFERLLLPGGQQEGGVQATM